MIFNNLFSSHLSNPNPSVPPPKLSNLPLTRTRTIQAHDTNDSLAVGQTFDAFSFALSNGIKPVPPPLSNKCIHARLETEHEMLSNVQKALDRAKSELKVVRNLQLREKKFNRDTEQKYANLRHIEMEEHAKELEDLHQKIEHWRRLSREYEERISKIRPNLLNITNASQTSAMNVEKATAERDEARASLTRQEELSEWRDNRRDIAVSALQHRLGQAISLLRNEAKDLRETVRSKDQKIAELKKFSEKSARKVEEKDSQIALRENIVSMEIFSREISCMLSEISEVVPFGQKSWQNLSEKMKALRGGVKELVSEVQNRR